MAEVLKIIKHQVVTDALPKTTLSLEGYNLKFQAGLLACNHRLPLLPGFHQWTIEVGSCLQ